MSVSYCCVTCVRCVKRKTQITQATNASAVLHSYWLPACIPCVKNRIDSILAFLLRKDCLHDLRLPLAYTFVFRLRSFHAFVAFVAFFLFRLCTFSYATPCVLCVRCVRLNGTTTKFYENRFTTLE